MNKVIIFGGDHYNALGLVRVFGWNNIRPYGILTADDKKNLFASKSKYWEKCWIVKNEEEGLKKIVELFSNECEKAVLVPSSDGAESVIDQNLDVLKENFYVPGIKEKQGAVSELMNKTKQIQWARSIGLQTAESWELVNVRDWLYVEDHCKAIDLVVREGKAGEVYNVGGHNEMKNIDIVKLTIKTIHDMMEADKDLRKVLRKQVRDANGDIDISWINDSLIEHVADRLGHDARYAIDPTKIKEELGWYPETKFADGIVKTIKWNLDNQQWISEVTSGDYQKYYDEMYGKERHGQLV